jgi:geranylgeranyl pyrophosphate synthase
VTRATTRGLEAPDPVLEDELRRRLNDVEAALEKAVRSDTDFVTEVASYLVAAGGKRLRPLLVLLCGYFGDATDPRLIQGAVAIELTHVATLYHDDVIDEAAHRHGVPSVNAKWSDNVAILAGDYLFARAAELSAELGTEVSRLLARTIATLCDGVIREVEVSGRTGQSVDRYMEIIQRKTAALIATSCRLGGILGDAPAETIEQLDDFGQALGLGFQLSDDIMDLVATEEVLKKEPGQDIKEGVYTLPILYAMEESGELQELLRSGPPTGEQLRRVLDIVREDRPLRLARAAVTGEVRRAIKLGSKLPAGRARDALLHIAEFIAVRCGAER